MKKVLFVLVVAALVLALPTAVLAAKPDKGLKGLMGQAGNSNVAFVELWEKDANWEIVEEGAWGKLKYNLEGPTFDFVFNGHGLEIDTEYSLIYYADTEDRYVDWGGDNPGALIASGSSNEWGDIHLMGPVELDIDLPHLDDANGYYYDYTQAPDYYDNGTGAKIWLVPSDCYDAGAKKVDTWSPTRFLFETDLITYTDTNAP